MLVSIASLMANLGTLPSASHAPLPWYSTCFAAERRMPLASTLLDAAEATAEAAAEVSLVAEAETAAAMAVASTEVAVVRLVAEVAISKASKLSSAGAQLVTLVVLLLERDGAGLQLGVRLCAHAPVAAGLEACHLIVGPECVLRKLKALDCLRLTPTRCWPVRLSPSEPIQGIVKSLYLRQAHLSCRNDGLRLGWPLTYTHSQSNGI